MIFIVLFRVREEIRRCLPFGLGIALNLFPIMTMSGEDENHASKQVRTKFRSDRIN